MASADRRKRHGLPQLPALAPLQWGTNRSAAASWGGSPSGRRGCLRGRSG